jgi:RNA polymerase sigma-70 factor (ECF subfamily)
MKDFRVAFEKLPDDQREALMLVGGAGFTYEEASEMCGVPIGTIKSRANRGRKRLAEIMGLEAGEVPVMDDNASSAVLSSVRGSV